MATLGGRKGGFPHPVPGSRSWFLSALFLVAVPHALLGQGTQACTGPQHEAFDFWIGEWEVRNPEGAVVGHNTIEKILNGCVVTEEYRTPSGYAGRSLNIFDSAREVWHQTWVDVGGLLLVLEGGPENGAMVLQGQTKGPGGIAEQRIQWSVVDGDPDRVRQLWETSVDGGRSWTVTFDGLYVRVEDSGAW